MTKMPGYPCATCQRQSTGWAIHTPAGDFHQFCSKDCAETFMDHAPLNHDETKAAIAGGDAGGAYLDQIGKTDLATMTADEWAEFCGRMFAGACAALKAMADDEIPF